MVFVEPLAWLNFPQALFVCSYVLLLFCFYYIGERVGGWVEWVDGLLMVFVEPLAWLNLPQALSVCSCVLLLFCCCWIGRWVSAWIEWVDERMDGLFDVWVDGVC